MAKLSQKQRKEFESVLSQLERAIEYIQGDKVSICRRVAVSTTTLDFTRTPVAEVLQNSESKRLGHYALAEVNKDIGSDIVGLYEAKRQLCRILESQL